MKLNWFSPIPPAMTGIAEYTAMLVPALAKRCELTLWTDQSDYDRSLERYCRVRQYDSISDLPGEALEAGSSNIYQIGNHPHFHGKIWELSRKCPGIVILHDFQLQYFFTSLFFNQGRPEAYVQEMGRIYGSEGLIMAKEVLCDFRKGVQEGKRFPLFELVAENARGIIVHTRKSLQAVQAQFDAPTLHLPLPYVHSGPPISANPLLRRSGPPWKLIAFGIFGPNRGLVETFEALAGLPEPLRGAFALDLYGTFWDEEFVKSAISRLGLVDQVRLLGFAPDEELGRALSKAHIAINLRNPTMGEASSSQLKIWNYALPTIVVDVGWYGEIPEGIVVHAHPDRLVEDTRRALIEMTQDYGRYMKMGQRAHHHVMCEHTTDAYATHVVALARSLDARVRSRSHHEEALFPAHP